MAIVIAKALSELKITRCGVLPYTIANGNLYFLLARHKATKELGDFGGGVRKSEDALMAGLRELLEESRRIFLTIYQSPKELSTKLALIGGNMAIIFAPLDSDWIQSASTAFEEVHLPTIPKKCSDEISSIEWVSEKVFFDLIYRKGKNNNKMWVKIQSFLKRSQINDLVSMLKSPEVIARA